MTIQEKRFLRRELINCIMQDYPAIGVYAIITRVRTSELGVYGQTLSVYKRRK